MSSEHTLKFTFALVGGETFELMVLGLDLVRLLKLDALADRG